MAQRRKSVMWTALAGVVAVLLFAGGAGAAQLITGADIENGSVTGKDIKNRSLVGRDFAIGQLPSGPTGPAGATGPPGPQGPAGERLLAIVTGTLGVVADGEQVQVPLENATFTQEAGTTIMLVTSVSATFGPIGDNECNIDVAWQVPELQYPFFPDTTIHSHGVSLTRGVFAITPAAADRALSLDVSANSEGVCQDGVGGVPSYQVEVEVAVLALQ